MSEVKLNLGPFNDCIDDVSERGVAEYQLFKRCAFCYDPARGCTYDRCSGCQKLDRAKQVFRVVESSNDKLSVSMLTIGTAHKEDTPENRKKLIRVIELQILDMVYQVAVAAGIDIINFDMLDRIKIPVRSATLWCDKFDTLRIVVEVGVCAFEEEVVVISE
jgi:hypothetical protein